MTAPTQAYVDARVADIQAAAGTRNSSAIDAVFDRIRADGYSQFADEFQAQLTTAGLQIIDELMGVNR